MTNKKINFKIIKEMLSELILIKKPELTSRKTLIDVYGLIEESFIDEIKIININEKLNKALQEELKGYLLRQPNGLIAVDTILKIIGELSGFEVKW